MNAAASAAAMAAMANSPYTMVGQALVGTLLTSVEGSALFGLLVTGETALLAAGGEDGEVLFTSARVIVAERVGILNKRRAVKAFRRDAICGYAIDADTMISLTLLGPSFGSAVLVFDEGFDPMTLSTWLGETLVGVPSTA